MLSGVALADSRMEAHGDLERTEVRLPVPCWGDFTARERTYLCYHVLSPWSDQLFLSFFFLISPEKTFSLLLVISLLMHIKPQGANLMCFTNFCTEV